MNRWFVGAPAFATAAVAVMGAATAPAWAEDPYLTLGRIKTGGKLKLPVMAGEEPGYIKASMLGPLAAALA
ncbi:hypothetical protein Mnod_3958 [Methylobacterium nodulans ORS 2060]|uniref:ABC transporter substrate-binding protein n=1 Tax=Methylobacterium nodulans (strain LMG 21967 / CNCM I-2342 / ORS 2060) TaxID=460265 RepID=B8ISK8_METNO|nr:hypothetical protein Mnod_3958 [Methylobacterium nodulans ORS 2060]